MMDSTQDPEYNRDKLPNTTATLKAPQRHKKLPKAERRVAESGEAEHGGADNRAATKLKKCPSL